MLRTECFDGNLHPPAMVSLGYSPIIELGLATSAESRKDGGLRRTAFR